MKDYFGEIPFLNGGIFECLDDKQNGIYIDGFSDTKKNQPILPNYLFFSGESNADLNKEYGTKNRNYKVRGIINTLSYYNFTIDENDPNDAEVALDPELLGKVFENLLASFNPETATTARKATGSYYTPREIVDYMVTESLKEYFKAYFNHKENLEKNLDILFNNESEKNPFSEQESKEIVKLIDNLRIVDPAVGSGAFPMSILNKLVHILSKLDPKNLLWKQAQLEVVFNIPDPKSRKDAIDNIEKNFQEKNVNYFRKLYLIQKCIYGVDIQQIAVEIAKLRFFISLLVDEKIDRENINGNWGVEPLPNLDFKIMQGDSLLSEFLGVDFDNSTNNQDKKGQCVFGFKEENNGLIKTFEQKKIDYQNETDRDKKNKLQGSIENLMVQLFEKKLQEKYVEINGILEDAKKIPNLKTREEYVELEKAKFFKKKGFELKNIEKQFKDFSSKNKKRPFFAWKLYFAEVFRGDNPGFDIVIANPPYGFRNILTAKEKKYFRKEKSINFPSGDIAELFIYISFDKLVRSGGIQTFIIPKKSLYGESWKNVRKYWISNNLHYLMDASKAFKNVLLEQVSFSISKKSDSKSKIKVGMLNSKDNRIEIFNSFCLNEVFSHDLSNAQIYRGLYPKTMMKKIYSNSIRNTSDMIKAEIGISNITNYLTYNKDDNYPCVKGIDIIKYGLKKERYLKRKIASRYIDLYLGDKIIAQEIIAHVQNPFPHIIITMFYDDNNRLLHDTCVEIKVLDSRLSKKFLLGYLQSSFCNWYAYNLIYNRAIRTMHFIDYYVSQIPIPQKIISEPEKQTSIIEIVEKILPITTSKDYLENQFKKDRVKKYEDEINQIVYQLYDLAEEEINIIEDK
jgi:adenine-specific DNA-methyltransferase